MEKFYSLAIECVINWGYIYSDKLDRNQELKFKIRSNELKLNKNVSLPKKFIYFDNPQFFEELKEIKKSSTQEKCGTHF